MRDLFLFLFFILDASVVGFMLWNI
jgi:hypothetical protein